MLCRRWHKEGLCEGQTATLRGRLNRDIDILTTTETVGEMDETSRIGMARYVVTGCAELLRHGGVRNDDPRDRGSVVRTYEYGRGGSGNSTICSRHTEETNSLWMMCMITSIEETHFGVVERAICEEQRRVIHHVGHGTVVSVSE